MSCNVHVGDADHSDYTATPFLRNSMARKCQVLRSLSILQPRNVVFKIECAGDGKCNVPSVWCLHIVRLGTLSSKLQKKKLIQKHFHPKTLSSKNTFVQNTFTQNTRQFHPRHFHPKTGSSNDTFIQKWFRPMTFSSKTGFIQ